MYFGECGAGTCSKLQILQFLQVVIPDVLAVFVFMSIIYAYLAHRQCGGGVPASPISVLSIYWEIITMDIMCQDHFLFIY